MPRKTYANKATLERLKEFYFYNPTTGHFHRYPRMNIVGHKGNRGYLTLTIDGKSYLCHRLAWFYMTGRWPDEIEHENRNRTDNRWDNLFEITRRGNNLNATPRRDNTSGVPGVHFHKQSGKWRARVDGVHLGLFVNQLDAVQAAESYRERLYQQERT